MKIVTLDPVPQNINYKDINEKHVVVLIHGIDKYILRHEPKDGYIFSNIEHSNCGAYGYQSSIQKSIEEVYKCAVIKFEIITFDNYDEFARWYVKQKN